MKKLFTIYCLFLVAGFACEQTPKEAPIDIEAERIAVIELLDQITTALKEQDIAALASLLSDDLLGCGSDPSEFWNKLQMIEIWEQMLVQPFEREIIGEPKVVVAPDGHSALTIQQY